MEFLHIVYCLIFVKLSFAINVGIGIYFIYSGWYLKKGNHALSLILTLRQQIIELINWRSQRNKH